MKNQFTAGFLTVVLFTAALLNLSCSTTQKGDASPVNTTSANNASVNPTQSSPTPVTADCSDGTTSKKEKIKKGVKENIDKNEYLRWQRDAKKFDFDVMVDGNNVTLHFWGKVYTSSKDLDNLNKTYKDYFNKGCVTNIVFKSAASTATTAIPFEFEICEYPNGICDNGTCDPRCARQENGNTNNKPNSNK